MGLVVSDFTNPWGSPASGAGLSTAPNLQPARPDLWQLDLRTPATLLPKYLATAYAAESSPANYPQMYTTLKNAMPTASLATYLARTVQLPKRTTGVGQPVRRDNGFFEAPGYIGQGCRVEVQFIHELAEDYNGSAIWALLTVWRAFARAGMGPDFPGSTDFTIGLLAAAKASGSGSGLKSPYRHDFSVTLLRPSTGTDSSPSSLTAGTGYVVKNAWPADFGVEQLSYENGKAVLELRASFHCDDVLPDTTGESGNDR